MHYEVSISGGGFSSVVRFVQLIQVIDLTVLFVKNKKTSE